MKLLLELTEAINLETVHTQKHIGSKTNIVSIGVKSEAAASRIVAPNNVNYIISPIIWSDKLSYPNVYNVEREEYHNLTNQLGGNKPSTGIATYNFFNRIRGFDRLDLIGFDFFESSVHHRNQLGHLMFQIIMEY